MDNQAKLAFAAMFIAFLVFAFFGIGITDHNGECMAQIIYHALTK